MNHTETLLGHYLTDFKSSITLERVNKKNLFIDKEEAAKVLGLPTDRLEHLQQSGQIPCAYYFNPMAGMNNQTAIKMYSVEVLSKWFDENRKGIATLPTRPATNLRK